MTESFPRGKTAIVGQATFGIGASPGDSSIDLAASAAIKALRQCNLTPADVDGLFVALPDDYLSGLSVAEYLGIHPRMTDNNRTGGSAFVTHAIAAATALDTGVIDVALIAYGSNQRSQAGKLVSAMTPPVWEGPYRLPRPAGAYALVMARYMAEYGATAEDFYAV